MTAATADNAAPASVVTALYLGTKTLHTEAERSGFIQDMLRGQASRVGYILYLRNLLPAYQELERGLKRHRETPALRELNAFDLARAPAIEADLRALCGGDWNGVDLLPAGAAYAQRIAETAQGDGAALIAHAYTRYLGDLSGGQILKRLLAKSPGLHPQELSFYDFPRFADLAALKNDYRQALDRAGAEAGDTQEIIDEGSRAFAVNIDLSWAVQKAVAPAAVGVAAD